MDRAIKPITANIGGVSIYVSAATRKAIRRRARQAFVIGGYVAGIGAATMAGVAVLQSSLLWPVVICGAVAGVVLWRCR
jgi:hypothetical protein